MSEPAGSDPLQFDRAEYAEPRAATCSACQAAITTSYYEVAGKVVCPACQARLTSAIGNQRGGGARFMTAFGYGLGAVAVGAGLYWAVRAATGYEIGFVAIIVGLLVGTAVKRGSGGRGGPGYQALAMGLTYTSIILTYVPDIIKAAGAHHDLSTAGVLLALPLVIGVAFIAPILAGFQNLIGMLIIGFALYEAWKINKRVVLKVSGPFQLAPAAPVAPVAPPPAPADAGG